MYKNVRIDVRRNVDWRRERVIRSYGRPNVRKSVPSKNDDNRILIIEIRPGLAPRMSARMSASSSIFTEEDYQSTSIVCSSEAQKVRTQYINI